MAQTVTFSSDTTGEHTQVLTLDGRCDGSSATSAEHQIHAALDAGRTQIIFDLRGVISLPPSMLQVLSRGAIEAKARDGQLVIVRPNAYVWALFEEHGLGRVFPTFADLGDAMAAAAAA
jgi:anti-anti-sigma factor